MRRPCIGGQTAGYHRRGKVTVGCKAAADCWSPISKNGWDSDGEPLNAFHDTQSCPWHACLISASGLVGWKHRTRALRVQKKLPVLEGQSAVVHSCAGRPRVGTKPVTFLGCNTVNRKKEG